MKRRCVPVVALLILAVTASVAYASALAPQTGSWKGKIASSDEAVSFKLQKTGDGYRAASTRLLVIAPCAAPDPNGGAFTRGIRARGMTVKLGSDGRRLRGTRKLTRSLGGGKATQTVSVALSFVSTRRAKVVVKAKYVNRDPDAQVNTTKCDGSLVVTAKPR